MTLVHFVDVKSRKLKTHCTTCFLNQAYFQFDVWHAVQIVGICVAPHLCANWLQEIEVADLVFDHLIGSHNAIALLCVFNRVWTSVST